MIEKFVEIDLNYDQPVGIAWVSVDRGPDPSRPVLLTTEHERGDFTVPDAVQLAAALVVASRVGARVFQRYVREMEQRAQGNSASTGDHLSVEDGASDTTRAAVPRPSEPPMVF